jgi:predicted ATPase
VSEEPPDEEVIRTPDQRLRVFVSSTLGELADERRAVSRAISALRLTPVLFELGARPHPPQDLYRAYLTQSDIFIGLYWQRYGQLGPGMEVSGLEEEFELSRGMPRLLYIKSPAASREPRLADLIGRVRQQAAYRTFRTPAELGRLVRDDLALLLSEQFGPAHRPVPPARRSPTGRRRLPVGATQLFGREEAIDEVAEMVVRPTVPLVTLTGPGGIGKSRLAIAVGERLIDQYRAGTVFVPLAAVTDPALVLETVGRAANADLSGTGSPLDAVAERLCDGAWLLILDNCEQVVGAAPDLGELLARCPGVKILATSRTSLGLRAEQEYPVGPLPFPADATDAPVQQVAASPAVALFVDRACAVHPDFALTAGNAVAVVEICRRLEGLPLAIELAAARTRLLEPGALLHRLAASLDVLGTGAVDMPERQRTLRATVEWSMGLLDDSERSLLETMAVFVDGWTIDAAARVAGLPEDQALLLSETLARHSLIYLDSGELGTRSRMLETIRMFVAERLAARPDTADIERRHAAYYRELTEQADRPLRCASHQEWLERLEAEAGNLAAAVRWYLAHEPGRLPHLFRVLWSFWELRDHMNEARAWVAQLLPAASSLDSQAHAELLWTATATANELHDDPAALAASQDLAPLLAEIDDSYLRAMSQLIIAMTMPIRGDFDGALQGLLASLGELRKQDEPYWTAVAALSAGYMETAAGRYSDALSHVREARELAERFGYSWLAAWSRIELGTLEVEQGRLEQARDSLDEALDLSLAIYVTRNVTLCLIAFARLALAEGHPERAAQLAGAVAGLRRRAAMGAWPMLRRPEAELVSRVREELGGHRFDEVHEAGARLSQREAVAAAQLDGGSR